jgi:hypothetical protein
MGRWLSDAYRVPTEEPAPSEFSESSELPEASGGGETGE